MLFHQQSNSFYVAWPSNDFCMLTTSPLMAFLEHMRQVQYDRYIGASGLERCLIYYDGCIIELTFRSGDAITADAKSGAGSDAFQRFCDLLRSFVQH